MQRHELIFNPLSRHSIILILLFFVSFYSLAEQNSAAQMFIKTSIISLLVVVTATVTQAAEVQWYTGRSCGTSSIDDRGVGCNVCNDPDGGMFSRVLFLCAIDGH